MRCWQSNKCQPCQQEQAQARFADDDEDEEEEVVEETASLSVNGTTLWPQHSLEKRRRKYAKQAASSDCTRKSYQQKLHTHTETHCVRMLLQLAVVVKVERVRERERDRGN